MRASGRDARLDVFRGVALVMIFVNHMPGNVFSHATLARLGFSDAAEVFVLLAGMAAVFAYGKAYERGGLRAAFGAVMPRIVRLYAVHLGLLALAAAVLGLAAAWFENPMHLRAMALHLVVEQPGRAALAALTLTYLPPYLDILPLYVVLLAATPALLAGFRVHSGLPLLVSGCLYGLARWSGANLPSLPEGGTWYFNPFAWQLLFVTGATIAHLQREGLWRVPARRLLTGAAAAFLVFGFAWIAPWRWVPGLEGFRLLPEGLLPAPDKTNLSPLRLANVLAQAWLAAVLLRRDAPLLEAGPSRLLGLMGRHSLEVFALGTLLAIAGSVALRETGHAMAVQIAVTLGGVAAMGALAWLLERRRTGTVGASALARLAGLGSALPFRKPRLA